MYHLEGCECPICHKPLQTGEDIVVCPDCGTPYHRDCYTRAGQCVYADRHADGFEWECPNQPAVDTTACPACGALNRMDAAFCDQCGRPLQAAPVAVDDRMADKNGDGIPDYIAQQLDLPDEVDGIPVKEWTTYIGPSAPYYLYQFSRQDKRGNKLGFILSAAFFAPYYFFYRRMWSVGIFAWVLNICLNLPQGMLLLQELGYVLPSGIHLAALSKLGWFASVLWIVVNALWGFFAVYLYRRHAAKTMRRWKAEAPSQSVYEAHLAAKSGPCRAVLFVIAGLFALSFLLSLGSVF